MKFKVLLLCGKYNKVKMLDIIIDHNLKFDIAQWFCVFRGKVSTKKI